MKKLSVILVVLALLLITGCQPLPIEEAVPSASLTEGVHTTSLSSESERTNRSTSIEEETTSDTGFDSTSVPTTSSSGKRTTTTTKTGFEIGCHGPGPMTTHFASVEEMLTWIHNDKYSNCTFKQTLKQLEPEFLLTIKTASDNFRLKWIAIAHSKTNMQYRFANEKNESVYLYVHLPVVNSTVSCLETYIAESNRVEQKMYETYPEPYVSDDVVILGTPRQTYKRDYGQAIMRETGKPSPVYAWFAADVDGFLVRGTLRGSLERRNWDNNYLKHFEFVQQDL